MNNKPLILIIILFVAALAVYSYVQQHPHVQAVNTTQQRILTVPNSSQSTTWQVYFSPEGGCTEAVVGAINKATSTILVQAYSFTSKPIAEALVEAQHRGVKIEVIVDKSELHGKGALASYLAESGIPVSVDAVHAIAHNKVIVIDGQTVVTGSFNFTFAAEKHNAENLLIIQDKTLAERYTENWKNHRQHSEGYKAQLQLAA